jgi:hypothetical protein
MSNFLEKGTQRPNDHTTVVTCIIDSSIWIEHIINSVNHRVKIIRRTQCMKSGSNGGIRSMNAISQ